VSAPFTESVVEEAALARLEAIGWGLFTCLRRTVQRRGR
jgi:hypothetical protein